MAENTAAFATKPRYDILDGLRGVAALMVVAFHLFETYSKGPQYQIINHGYLAVDFFFVLSGFVIGYAYDDRWGRMTTWEFFKRRLVRLHPLVILGTLFGACLFFFQASPAFPNMMTSPMWKVLLCLLMGILMIPCGKNLDIRGWREMNSFNGPNWSLTWEYLGNILYALVVRRFPRFLLGIFVALCAVCTVDVAMNLDLFGMLDGYHAPYCVIGGWSLSKTQAYIGITRMMYPFFMGLLLSRIGKLFSVKDGFWWCSLIIVVALAIPHVGGEQRMWMDGLYNLFCILFLFPFVVLLGAGSKVSGRKSSAVCSFLGEISYPIYVMHYPLIYLQIAWASAHRDAPVWMHVFVAVGVFLLSIGISYAALKAYDLPVRKYLREKFLRK